MRTVPIADRLYSAIRDILQPERRRDSEDLCGINRRARDNFVTHLPGGGYDAGSD